MTDNETNGSKSEASPEPGAAADKDSVAVKDAAGETKQSAIDAVAIERDKFRDQLLRTAAEFDNFRKRSRRDLDEAKLRAKDELIRDLLPVFDNLERALATAGGARDLASVVEGVRMVLKLFEDTAERIGLAKVPALGQRFDPAVHEAIQQKETDEQPPGTVIAEIAAGYRFKERLVRPAMVVVARKAPQKVEPGAGAAAADPPAAEPKTEPSPNPEQPNTDKPS